MQNIKQLRGAIIGYGNAGTGHGKAYRKYRETSPDVSIVAIADICTDRRTAASVDFPEANVYTDADILFEREIKNLDFIDIATPVSAHAPTALKALQLGLHVICENPFVETPEEAVILTKRAQDSQRVLFTYAPWRFSPIVSAAHDAVERRLIGKINAVSIDVYREAPEDGTPEWNPEWRTKHQYGIGGVATDMGFNAIYLALDWMGTIPTQLTAKTEASRNKKNDAVEEGFCAYLTFPNGGAQLRTHWNAGLRKFFSIVHGESGALTAHNDKLEITVMQKIHRPEIGQKTANFTTEKKLAPSLWEEPGHPQWFGEAFLRFRQAIENGEYVTKETNLSRIAAVLLPLAYRSAKEGREIFLENI